MSNQLKVVENSLASYLKFSPDEASKFTYYTFDVGQTEHWDILGVRFLNKNPLLIDIRLMYIDQSARDWEPFVAERDAPGFVTFDPSKYLKVIAFFEMLLGKEISHQDKLGHHFSLMDREELLQLHYSSYSIESADTFYRYTLNREVQDPDMISVVCFPHWSPKYGVQQISSLWFISLSQQHLKNPTFDLVDDADGLGTLRFNRSSLEEFVVLLKKMRKHDL